MSSRHLDITIEYLDGYITEAKSEVRIDVDPEYLDNLQITGLCDSMLQMVISKMEKERKDEFQEVCDEASKYRHAMTVAMEHIRQGNSDKAFDTLQEAEA